MEINYQFSKEQLYTWADSFETCCILNTNGYKEKYSTYDLIIAVGKKSEVKANHGNAFTLFSNAYTNNYLFGYFGYDLKNEIEKLTSLNPAKINFPDIYFFEPEHIVLISPDNTITIISDDKLKIINEINSTVITSHQFNKETIVFNKTISKNQYIQKIKSIKNNIIEGDVYELNFCQEFIADNIEFNTMQFFTNLMHVSPTPFANYLKFDNKYIIGASPERFLQKKGNKLISQPIKGTIKRGANKTEDENLKRQLQNSEKERAENVMIVDLVRNDLTKSAKTGTIKVEELFGMYTFNHWHQMISTISAEIMDTISTTESIKNTFPMGSMTGAPKIKAMQLIDGYEVSKRGVYSGALGYFTPNKEFDLNVVIRTLLYDATAKMASFEVGSAITFDSDPEYEYEECLLKAQAILRALNAKIEE